MFDKLDIDWTSGVSYVASITEAAFEFVDNIGHSILPLNGRFTRPKHSVKIYGDAK